MSVPFTSPLDTIRDLDPAAIMESSSTSASGSVIIESSTGRFYDTRKLSLGGWSRAQAGLQADYTIGQCKVFGDHYYAFRLVRSDDDSDPENEEGHTVRVGNSPGKPPIRCSCDDYAQRGKPCKHVFWLADKLMDYSMTDVDQISGALTLRTQDGAAFLDNQDTPFAHIQERVVEALMANDRIPPPASVKDIRRHMQWPVAEQIRDLLSTFVEGSDPDNFLAHTDPEMVLQKSLSDSTWIDKLFAICMSKPIVFQHLRSVFPADYCSEIYFSKVDSQVMAIFELFDQAGDPQSAVEGVPDVFGLIPEADKQDSHQPTVAWCAKALRGRVEAIRSNVHKRSPLGHANKVRACKTLVGMLQRVIAHHEDSVTSPLGPRRSRSTSVLSFRAESLYDTLLGDSAIQRTLTRARAKQTGLVPDSPYFVLDVLDMPQLRAVTRDSAVLSILEHVLQDVKDLTSQEGFVERLESMVESATEPEILTRMKRQASSQAGPSSGKKR